MSRYTRKVLNLPNLLTLFRIALIPVVCGFLYQRTEGYMILAAISFGLASFTDFFDGYLARSRGLVSVLGKFLDPLADKLIVMGVLVVLVELGRFPAWLVIIVLAREIAITGLRSIASSEGVVIAAGESGKSKTAFQLTGLVGLIIHYPFEVNFFLFSSPVDFHKTGFILFVVSVFFSLWSAFIYTRDFLREMAKQRETAPV
ncbi:MAG: CDP-diacylglycerol--glycerol-3-phosphate 3-phosphatidyltransferase [Bradymonadales bacterium]|nr:CDP-diacylglycerol--glycerol-3-phosphate 3-phosphatidyltransferase [Bradymonadales bacterium]